MEPLYWQHFVEVDGDDDCGTMEPWHWQHVAIVKVDVNHHPIHILQLAHLIYT